MRRALASLDSRRTFFALFDGLVSVVLVSVGVVVAAVVVVVAAGAVVWAGACASTVAGAGAAAVCTWTGAASLAVVAAWASRTATWAIGFGTSATIGFVTAGVAVGSPARLRLRLSPAWAEAEVSSRAEIRMNLRM